MNGTLQIAVDLEEGVVQLGSERVRLLPGRGDAFYLNNRRGPMVRALRFEERSLLLTANTANASNGDVASLIADAAFVSSGECDEVVRVAVSLALAGGGEEAPSFSECARLVEEHAGWNPERVSGTLALVIDRLCGKVESNGWERIVFEEDEPDLETLISRMAANLSERAVASAPSGAKTEADEITTTKPAKPVEDPPAARPKHVEAWPGFQFEPQSNKPLSPTPGRSVPSVSSGLPVDRVKRIPARVLALTPLRNRAHDNPVNTAPRKPASTLDLPERARTNQAGISLTQTASAVLEQPIFASPSVAGWQPFNSTKTKTLIAQNGVPYSEALEYTVNLTPPEQTATRFSPTAESPSFNDWLSELAMLLEAECDLRGIDP
jgi:hypothetical protein